MYYAFIENGKINGAGQCKCLTCENIEITKEVFENISLYAYQNGEIVYVGEPIPTDDEQKQNRAAAYQAEVDPITAHIERLRDEAEPDEAKIAELIAERTKKVEEIKQRFPYKE